jgi:hypothetical protein
MYMDAQNRPSLNQSLVIGAPGTLVSTDSIDMLTGVDNPGRSAMLRAIAVLTVALVGAGSSIRAELIQSDNANLSSPDVLSVGATFAVAAAGAGTKLLDVPLPDTTKRYLGYQYVITGALTTAGQVTAGLVGGTDRNASVVPMNLGV